jgi:hypothetical protein
MQAVHLRISFHALSLASAFPDVEYVMEHLNVSIIAMKLDAVVSQEVSKGFAQICLMQNVLTFIS